MARPNSDTLGTSETSGTSETRTMGTSRTAGRGRNETIHHRPLIQPNELGRRLRRIDDRSHPHYPGLALVLVSGADPMIVRRMNYFEDPFFIDCFSPHPDHVFTPAVSYSLEGKLLWEQLENADARDEITKWLLAPGQVAIHGQVAAIVGDDPSARLFVPLFGKVTATACVPFYRFPDGNIRSPTTHLFTVKSYPQWTQDSGVDPFAEIRALPRRGRIQAPLQPPPQPFLVPQPSRAPERSSYNTAGYSSGSKDFPWRG